MPGRGILESPPAERADPDVVAAGIEPGIELGIEPGPVPVVGMGGDDEAGAWGVDDAAGAGADAAETVAVGAVAEAVAVAGGAIAVESDVAGPGVGAPGRVAEEPELAVVEPPTGVVAGAVMPSAASAARSLRATGGSMVEDGPLTN